MSKVTRITANGDHSIREPEYVTGSSALILVESNPDSAGLIPGYRNSSGTFSAFPDPNGEFSVTYGGIINHLVGDNRDLELMIRVSGIGANPVVIRVNP